MIDICGFPLIGTSCNLADQEPITNAKDAKAQFGDKVEKIVDGGDSTYKEPSTIVKVDGEKIHILREGPIKLKEIEERIF